MRYTLFQIDLTEPSNLLFSRFFLILFFVSYSFVSNRCSVTARISHKAIQPNTKAASCFIKNSNYGIELWFMV